MAAILLVDEDDGTETEIQDREFVQEHPCGSQFFYLCDDGTIECGMCHKPLPSFRWSRTGTVGQQ